MLVVFSVLKNLCIDIKPACGLFEVLLLTQSEFAQSAYEVYSTIKLVAWQIVNEKFYVHSPLSDWRLTRKFSSLLFIYSCSNIARIFFFMLVYNQRFFFFYCGLIKITFIIHSHFFSNWTIAEMYNYYND